MCVAFMACFELIPSPKSQSQEVGASPVPVSVNKTTRGVTSDVKLEEKSAAGTLGSVTLYYYLLLR